jgi:hypothetical protein
MVGRLLRVFVRVISSVYRLTVVVGALRIDIARPLRRWGRIVESLGGRVVRKAVESSPLSRNLSDLGGIVASRRV